MKKLIVILLFLSSYKIHSINNNILCVYYAFDKAMNSGYDYGSEDWQWVYYAEKMACEYLE